ncbi:nucleotide-binding domain-containing protein [Cobetia amphilecti]|uniref:nucleotide-binding domain-containing protein n=1 Tax=Cobetia amphilecti TaxID=1055104 RepID=UPI00337FD4EB
MSVSDMFRGFLDNLKVDNSETISSRYGEITASLNKKFRDSESKEANSLRVGSYGRYTGIKGISDLDMLYIMPKGKWEAYKNGKQSQLLTDVKDAIKSRYPSTNIRVDRLVVTVTYKNFHVEVQPVFEEFDEGGSFFKYPDTYNGGSWKVTKPRQEMREIKNLNEKKNSNLRLLCKMARAWKNKHGVAMGGLLIDTLAYNFMKSTSFYDDKSFLYFDYLSRDFFDYLAEQPDQDIYKAPGSNQNVKVKKSFQKKARQAYNLCLKAIDARGTESENNKWKKVYGRSFPAKQSVQEAVAKAGRGWRNTEEFIEDTYPEDIKFTVSLDCDVSQNGFRENSLINIIMKGLPLRRQKRLSFKVVSHDVPHPFSLKWKVLNRGEEAHKRDCIRGQIEDDDGSMRKSESTDFKGEHLVECYAVKDGVVVAKSKIDVPIQ